MRIMRLCGFCKHLQDGVCAKGYIIEPLEKLNGFKRPKQCTKKQESVTKRKQASDSWLNKQLDKLWSQAVRQKGYCELCGRKPPEVVLHAHHIFSRRHYSTRWDVNNGLSLCNGCHLYSAHRNIQEFADWVCDKIGREKLDDLRKKAHTVVKYTKEDKLKMINELNEIIDNNNKKL